MYCAVTSDDVAAYRQAVESLARQFVDNNILCEWDDLVQEGLIAVWESLQDGRPPSTSYIELAMRQWRRRMWRLNRGDSIAETVLYPEAEDSLEELQGI